MSMVPAFLLVVTSLVPTLFGPAKVSAPSISQDRVAEVVGERNVALSACYQEGLDKNEKLQGKVAVEMKVTESGLVTDASSTKATTLKDQNVVECVVKIMSTLDFGKQDAPQTIRYSMDFAPEKK